MSAFGLWQLKASVSSSGSDAWIGAGLLALGLWTFGDCWKASRGVHELQWEPNHATITSDGKIVFGGSFPEIKAIVGDQLGYDLHLGTSFVYRVKSVDLSDELRTLLDAACAK
jgi:hypothetical protein